MRKSLLTVFLMVLLVGGGIANALTISNVVSDSPYPVGYADSTYDSTTGAVGTWAESNPQMQGIDPEIIDPLSDVRISVNGNLTIAAPEWIFLHFTHEGYLSGDGSDYYASSLFEVNIGDISIVSYLFDGNGYDVNSEFWGSEFFVEVGSERQYIAPGNNSTVLDYWFAIYLEGGAYDFSYSLHSSARSLDGFARSDFSNT